jgi:hypothetical protein
MLDVVQLRAHLGLTAISQEESKQMMLKQRVDSIDVVKFLEDIVNQYDQVQDPRAFLEWIATVSVFILEQIEFECITETIQ